MQVRTRQKMKQALKDFVTTDATDFELIWTYHRIFHERKPIDAGLPDCPKCKELQK